MQSAHPRRRRCLRVGAGIVAGNGAKERKGGWGTGRGRKRKGGGLWGALCCIANWLPQIWGAKRAGGECEERGGGGDWRDDNLGTTTVPGLQVAMIRSSTAMNHAGALDDEHGRGEQRRATRIERTRLHCTQCRGTARRYRACQWRREFEEYLEGAAAERPGTNSALRACCARGVLTYGTTYSSPLLLRKHGCPQRSMLRQSIAPPRAPSDPEERSARRVPSNAFGRRPPRGTYADTTWRAPGGGARHVGIGGLPGRA